MKSHKWLAGIVIATLTAGMASAGMAASRKDTVPGAVYGVKKAIEKAAEQARETLQELLQKENPGLSKDELKKQVEVKVQQEVKHVAQQKLETAGVKDVSAEHWAGVQLAVLVESGFIQPDAKGEIKPDAATSVDQTAALFAKVLGVASPTDDAETAAQKAEQAGLVRNRTAFDRDMTRIELAYMLVTALDIAPKADVNASEMPFRDFFLMSKADWGVVAALYEQGIFKGFEDKTFRPYNVLTKAQVAVVVDRVLTLLGH